MTIGPGQLSFSFGRWGLSSYAALMPQILHYCIIAYCARKTDCPRVHSEAADIQPRLQFYRQFTAARLYDMFKFSSVYSSILKPFQPSQLQPDDSRSRLEQPRQDFHPHGMVQSRTIHSQQINVCQDVWDLKGGLRLRTVGLDWVAETGLKVDQ